MSYDLHMHSHYSDGTLSPTQLMSLADEKQVAVCALTDHDTLAGLPEARIAAEQHTISLINGVELSASWNGQLVHIVGLNFDCDNDQLLVGIAANQKRRRQRAQKMFDDFARHDIELRELVLAQLPEKGIATRPHFANALIELGKAKDNKQAFRRFLTRGNPGYIAVQWPSISEVSQWLSVAGGVGVLAHPLIYKMTRSKLKRLLTALTDCGIHGIEVSTARSDQQQQEAVARLASEHNMFASIGSDFHSLQQPWCMVGSATPLANNIKPVWQCF